jgi:hypothetical protein
LSVRGEVFERVSLLFGTGRGLFCRLDRQLRGFFSPFVQPVGLFKINVRWGIQVLAFPHEEREENEADSYNDRGGNGAGNDPFAGHRHGVTRRRSQGVVRLRATNFQYFGKDSAIVQAYRSNWAVGKRVGEADEEEDVKEGDRVDEVGVGRDADIENTVLLITEV